jgi:RNA polymerase sigma factor (sigma-70 family)
MANVPYHAVLQFLRKATNGRASAELTDGQLLERFRDLRDEAAFAALLERHGPLVLGVCHRLLHNPHDTEDAFQATFFILVRKAHSIVKKGSVASWLHGVAHRVALRLKGDKARRRQHECQASRPPAPDLLRDIVWCDLRAMLDEEVLRLPARCREPFVLCYLEGKTNQEAARLLGCPKGTVQSRLAHARELLRTGLARRGLTLSGSLLATNLPQPTAPAASAALMGSTLRMALATLAPAAAAAGTVSTRVLTLAQGVLHTMVLSKVKAVVGVLLVAGVLVGGVGAPGWTYRTQAVESVPTPATASPQPAKVSPARQADVRTLLHDPDPQVRLKAALALAERLDEEAIGVLIDLLTELPPPQRKLAEQALQQLAEEWSPTPALAGDDEIALRILRDAWAGWWRNADGQALLAAFKKWTLSPEQTAKALALIADLNDEVFAKRQRAVADLVAFGPPVVPLLRQALPGAELEQANRIKQCLKQIAKTHDRDTLPTVAARLLALRKPAGASETLLAYLPFTDDEVMKWEVAKALKTLAGQGARADPALVKALEDTSPVRRAVAGEVLAGAADAEVRPAVRKLLADSDLAVRLRVAVALVCAADKQAVPVLIDLLADAPGDQWWRAEEILHGLAGATAPQIEPAEDAAARTKYRDAWKTWWKDNAATTKLAALPIPPPLLGFTVIAAIADAQPSNSRVLEVDRNGKVRWQFDGLNYPMDAHVLPGNRVLISEHAGLRITERDFRGNILWQKNDLPAQPNNVQRLANGNTFVCTRAGLMEIDAAGKTVLDIKVDHPFAACKTADGQMIYLTADGICIRLDAAGKEVKRFITGLDGETGGWIDLTPRGRIIADHLRQIGVGEFDLQGKRLWQTSVTTSSTAVRNGHVLAVNWPTSYVTEFDRAGRMVWQYLLPAGYKPWRARMR